ncbi:MAG: YchJ family protein [Polyangiaceae bacterium]|nr:YchJ family protein [Polyangiaceae bacterium]
MSCHCGKDESYETCCLPLIKGDQRARTAEELMRARYAAFVEAEVDYIMSTHDPDTVHQVDRDSTAEWAKQSEWHGLEIIETEAGGPEDRFGRVDFAATYELKGTKVEHRESATFRRDGDRWLFVDGTQIAGPPVVRDAPKIGRNDPCICGSGKKYKKCCGKAA